jgi:hypothetical protein
MIDPRLTILAKTILNTLSSSAQKQRALDNFVELCSHAGQITPNPSFDAFAQDAYLAQGLAINPEAAAQCVKDYRRSVVFIQGVHEALQILLKQNPNGSINILYAGCGPYATQLLPLLSLLDHRCFTITLLDIHISSLNCVKTLISSFGLDMFSINYVHADATTFQHTSKFDLILSEVMQKALEQEPQVSVTANLAPQLTAQGFFIPERIDIELALIDLVKEHKSYEELGFVDSNYQLKIKSRKSIANIFSLTSGNANAFVSSAVTRVNTRAIKLSNVTFPSDFSNYNDVVLFTRIKVFNHHCLCDYECDLTLPRRLNDLDIQSSKTFEVNYILGNYPKFEFIVI